MAWSRSEAGLPGAFSRSQYHSAYSPFGAKAGTEYTPQWMKIPNLASVHHAGVGRLSTDAQSGATVCAVAPPQATQKKSINKGRMRISSPQSAWKTSVIVDHHSSAAAVGH